MKSNGASKNSVKEAEAYEWARRMIYNGDEEGFVQLLHKHPDLARRRDSPGNGDHQPTLLHELSTQNAPELAGSITKMARCLLNAGADKDTKDQIGNTGQTPLHSAVMLNNTALCRVLLEDGANAELSGSYDGSVDTALGYALFFEANERIPRFVINCSDLLIKHGARLYLPFVAALGQFDRVRQCFRADHSLSLNAGIASPKKTLAQAFLFACLYGQVEIGEHLLYRGAKINTILPFFDQYCSGLHLACSFGQHTEMVAFLLENGADPDCRDNRYNATPAGWAMFNGQDEVFRLFLEKGIGSK